MSTKNWEEAFDAEFKESFAGGDMWNYERARPIKHFIRTLLSKQREEVKGKIEEARSLPPGTRDTTLDWILSSLQDPTT